MKNCFETERLIIRRLQDSDLEDFYEYAKSPVVGPMAGWKPHSRIEITKAVLDAFKKSQTVWALVYKKENKMIGTIELRPLNPKLFSRPDIFNMGYCLNEDYWGKGLTLEACLKIIDYAFLDLRATKIQLSCFDNNYQSRRVIEKLGFNFLYKKESNKPNQISEYLRVYEYTKYDYERKILDESAKTEI